MKNVDLVYFGYECDSRRLEKEFIEEVSKAFPTAKLENAYDDIKGYRRRVFIEEEKEDDYLIYIFAHGWYGCSLTLQLMFCNDQEKLYKLYERGKREYPECIKKRESNMAEIKISELSIGDWVEIDGAATKVWYLSEDSDINDTTYDWVKPIPLTTEILEKNGFDAPKAKVWNDSWYWSNRKDVALELRESFGLWYMEIVTKEQRSGLQSNRKLGIGFKYVHQLQHALRLAGVEKEIEV